MIDYKKKYLKYKKKYLKLKGGNTLREEYREKHVGTTTPIHEPSFTPITLDRTYTPPHDQEKIPNCWRHAVSSALNNLTKDHNKETYNAIWNLFEGIETSCSGDSSRERLWQFKNNYSENLGRFEYKTFTRGLFGAQVLYPEQLQEFLNTIKDLNDKQSTWSVVIAVNMSIPLATWMKDQEVIHFIEDEYFNDLEKSHAMLIVDIIRMKDENDQDSLYFKIKNTWKGNANGIHFIKTTVLWEIITSVTCISMPYGKYIDVVEPKFNYDLAYLEMPQNLEPYKIDIEKLNELPDYFSTRIKKTFKGLFS